MDEFRKKIKARIRTGTGLLGMGLLLIMGNRILGENSNAWLDAPEFLRGHVNDALHGFNTGLICGLMAVVVFYICVCTAALGDDAKLKKLYVKETDERTLLIFQKSGAIGMNVSMIGLLIGAFVSAYFSFVVFVTLLGACLFVLLVHIFLKLYYHKKY